MAKNSYVNYFPTIPSDFRFHGLIRANLSPTFNKSFLASNFTFEWKFLMK